MHTFSSLNREFMAQYAGCFEGAGQVGVYFNPHALRMKKLPQLEKEEVKNMLSHPGLEVFNDSCKMVEWLKKTKQAETNYLFMSSGNFDGIDLKDLAEELV